MCPPTSTRSGCAPADRPGRPAPTTGPLLFRALLAQDMYLAGSTVMLLTILTVLGTLVSDAMLVWGDPRIRYARRESG